jgi:hypothetical protein
LVRTQIRITDEEMMKFSFYFTPKIYKFLSPNFLKIWFQVNLCFQRIGWDFPIDIMNTILVLAARDHYV